VLIGLGAVGYIVRTLTRPASKGCGKGCDCAQSSTSKDKE
jgi:hypothetical protein